MSDNLFDNQEDVEENKLEAYELLDEWIKQNKAWSNEGRKGVANLLALLKDLDPDYNSLSDFLEDNPGAIEVLFDWIGEYVERVPTWEDNLRDVLGDIEEDSDDESEENENEF